MRPSLVLRSGGGNYPYPKWVWSWYGGWWPTPQNYVSNTIVTGLGIATIVGFGWKFSADRELRHRYPDRWIPSMIWAKEFHDPASVAMWKEQLAKEGREWIEPTPSWWPFKAKEASPTPSH
ncbi:hypothetical protein SmJEL517_g05536 [Synchytrium microbalum]|uniref:Uncharacterized protein n=1 Tax=Synchytrium microbalum TaxID=1806994 RepID=A0A507BYX0_9FUNG|nr:uncharacterized protein SmJEL517_g05536 [Synchytrium microbalum]TPX31014.1 hypothetical protein SmJEL517_g05536 [Synchytrium microbalum]